MLVAATTACFPDLPLREAIERLVDLEYTHVDIAIRDDSVDLTPERIVAEPDRAAAILHNRLRTDVIDLDFASAAEGETYLAQFKALCRLAKQAKVAVVTIESAPRDMPFNEELERLKGLVSLAEVEGIRIRKKTQGGRHSEDPDTVELFCNNARGLGVTLDPSYYVCGPYRGRSLEAILPFVSHVLLRDTGKDKLHVRLGQGETDFNRLIHQLQKVKYQRALAVDVPPTAELDTASELRNMRLLLESLL